MLLGPACHLGKFKREIVTIPDVEKKGENRSLMSADGLFVESYGILGAKVFRQPLELDQARDDLKTLGENAPGLGWGHGLRSLSKNLLSIFINNINA